MKDFIAEEQLAVSTADEERNYFINAPVGTLQPTASALPAGTYRVLDGQLYRIVSGEPEPLLAARKPVSAHE